MKAATLTVRRLALCFVLMVCLNARSQAGDIDLESRPHPPHGLDGRRIVVDAGHGRTWNETALQWAWERPILHNEVEDLITARIVNRWVVRYLQNAGATVLTTRERDEQVREVRIDDGGGEPDFEISGAWNALALPAAYGGSAHVAATQPDSEGPAAVWFADLPATDTYGLCIWYPAADNATTATYIVHAAGGDVVLSLNQAANTAQWLWIDWFVFPAGRHPVLTLTSLSNAPGTIVVADAIRLGGGMGDADWGGGPSGLPRWQEYSKSYAKLYGAPDWVWDQPVDQTDYNVRYAFAGWLGGDFHFHLHTNADATGSGTASGTTTPAAYARDEQEAQALIWAHNHLVERIQERWMPTWRNRGAPVPQIYPLEPYPTWFIELAFHDRLEPDLRSLVDADFRSIAGRGIYEGIAHILGGPDVVFLPEPPQAPLMENLGQGRVRVQWSPSSWGPAPTSYVVTLSRDGVVFDPGHDVGLATEYVAEGLSNGETLYGRVVAENEGGRSFPTETLGVRVADFDCILVVNGFDRLDQQVQETDNPRWFVRDHTAALAAARPEFAIDSASNKAVVAGRIHLGDYKMVDWILGKESTDDDTFSSPEQALVSSYFNAGGRLLVTGTDIGTDLITSGSDADRRFARERLQVESLTGSTFVARAAGVPGQFLEGLVCDMSTTPSLPYDSRPADVLAPRAGATAILEWTDGSGAAGIAYGNGPGKIIVLSTPLEAIANPSAVPTLTQRALDFLLALPDPDSIPPQILLVAPEDIQARQARVHWTSNELTIGSVEWWPEGGSSSITPATTDYLSDDSITLTGLLPETTYHLRVTVEDYAGNETQSQEYTFTTLAVDTTPPSLVGFHAYPFSDRAALVVWTADEASHCQIEYGPDASYGFLSDPSTKPATRHRTLLSGLAPNTAYHFRIRMTDVQENTGYGPDAVFATRPSDSTPPAIADVRVLDVSHNQAILTWTTNEPSTSQVEWGTGFALGNFSPRDDAFVVTHVVSVDSLTSTATIRARAISVDAAGNEAWSSEVIFDTLDTIPQVIVDNSDPGFSCDGVWATSTMMPEERYGPNYRWKAVKYPGDLPAEARWRGTLPRDGLWQAHCWYVIGPNRASDTPYYVRYAGGEETVRVDQLNDGGVFFHPIGAPRYYSPGEAVIAMSNDATTGNVVIADAVMWQFAGLGEASRYRSITPRDILAFVLDVWPLDPAVESAADLNADGAVDIGDFLQACAVSP